MGKEIKEGGYEGWRGTEWLLEVVTCKSDWCELGTEIGRTCEKSKLKKGYFDDASKNVSLVVLLKAGGASTSEQESCTPTICHTTQILRPFIIANLVIQGFMLVFNKKTCLYFP